MSGKSLTAVKEIADKEFSSYLFASVYRNPVTLHSPDIWVEDLPWPHILEWNIFNSVMAGSIAVDFDGILCHDCTFRQDDDGPKYLDFIQNATPLYLPRKEPIPLIVTARIEQYRQQTEQWLERHKVKFERLVMHPAKTLFERKLDDVCRYKAKHFNEMVKKSVAVKPYIFFESDDKQARQIAKYLESPDGLVICPSTMGVYRGL